MSTIKDSSLSSKGLEQFSWARRQMQVLADIKSEFESTKPLQGIKLGACMHVTKETANLMLTIKAAGADVALCASNPLSTDDSIAAFLADSGIEVHAVHGVSNDDFYKYLNPVNCSIFISTPNQLCGSDTACPQGIGMVGFWACGSWRVGAGWACHSSMNPHKCFTASS